MLDPSIRKFAKDTGHKAARVLIPTAYDLAERDRLAFRLTVAIASAVQTEYDNLDSKEGVA